MIYISGPTDGLKDRNFPAFEEAEKLLQLTWRAIYNPERIPRPPFDSVPGQYALRGDLRMMTYCERIYMLPHWQNDKRSVWEHRVAEQIGLVISYAPIPDHPVTQVLND